MNYEFPIIRTIDDVLPAIEGRDEFIVAERDLYTVINYAVAFTDTFDIDPSDTMDNYGKQIPKGVMRRECRGLMFDKQGKLISRPFHKFHNINEREDTQVHNLDFTQPHFCMDKLDGSMIRPIMVDGEICLATKMGFSDVAAQAQKFFDNTENRRDYVNAMKYFMAEGYTPIYEYISPENLIVVEYATENLVLTAIRNNETGEYTSHDDPIWHHVDGVLGGLCLDGIVQVYDSVEDITAFLKSASAETLREGYVIQFANGHMVKLKNTWYVDIHRTKDDLRRDRYILKMILDGTMDDMMPMLDQSSVERVETYDRKFHNALNAMVAHLEEVYAKAFAESGPDKKKMATEVLPALGVSKLERGFILKAMDGKVTMHEQALAYINKNINGSTKYNYVADWLDLEQDKP